MTAAEIFKQKNIEAINHSITSKFIFGRLVNATFWNTASLQVKDLKEELTIFTIYLLAYYGFDEWQNEILGDADLMAELPEAFEVVTGKRIKQATITEGLQFIEQQPNFIKTQSFEGLLEEVAVIISDSKMTEFSKDGYVEKGAQPDMTKYDND